MTLAEAQAIQQPQWSLPFREPTSDEVALVDDLLMDAGRSFLGSFWEKLIELLRTGSEEFRKCCIENGKCTAKWVKENKLNLDLSLASALIATQVVNRYAMGPEQGHLLASLVVLLLIKLAGE